MNWRPILRVWQTAAKGGLPMPRTWHCPRVQAPFFLRLAGEQKLAVSLRAGNRQAPTNLIVRCAGDFPGCREVVSCKLSGTSNGCSANPRRPTKVLNSSTWQSHSSTFSFQQSFRRHAGNYLAAVATINSEVLIGCENDGIGKRFSHAQQARVGEAHQNTFRSDSRSAPRSWQAR